MLAVSSTSLQTQDRKSRNGDCIDYLIKSKHVPAQAASNTKCAVIYHSELVTDVLVFWFNYLLIFSTTEMSQRQNVIIIYFFSSSFFSFPYCASTVQPTVAARIKFNTHHLPRQPRGTLRTL